MSQVGAGRHPRPGGRGPDQDGPDRCLLQTSGTTEKEPSSDGTSCWSGPPAREARRGRTDLHLRSRSDQRAARPSRRPASTRTPASRTSATRSSSPCATGSRTISRSRETCAARCRRTSAARSRSARTRASATVVASRCAVSAPRPTRAPARAPSAPWPARRRPVSDLRLARVTATASEELVGKRTHASQGPYRGRQEGAPQGEEERRCGPGPHQEHVQQHDHLDHRPHRGRHRLGLCRPGGLQGFAQVHAVRRADRRRGCCTSRHGARHAQGRRLRQGPGFRSRDRHPLPDRRRPRGRFDQDVTPSPHNGVRPPKRRRV